MTIWEAAGYQIQEDGTILGKTGKPMRTRVNHKGYERVGLMVDGKQKHFYVHVIIATKYCKKLPHHTQVNHKDGDRLNNHKDNLEWCTGSENILHRHHGSTKGNPELYAKIAELRASGMSYGKIASALSISTHTAHKYGGNNG